MAVVTLSLLAAMVWFLNPSQPDLRPAPLRPQPAACPNLPREFTPTNHTQLPDLPLDKLSREQMYRALYRLNMEPCPCGCRSSLAECRVRFASGCKTSKELASQIVSEVKEEAAR